MSNGYTGYHLFLKPGHVAPEELVKKVIETYSNTSGMALAKNGKLTVVQRKDGPWTLQQISKVMEVHKAVPRLFTFGLQIEGEVNKEDVQPFGLIGEIPDCKFIACLDGVFVDKDKSPFSRDYAVYQQVLLPKLTKLYAEVDDDVSNMLTWDDMLKGHDVIKGNKAVLTILAASGEMVRIQAPDCNIIQGDWGFGSCDLDKGPTSNVVSGNVSAGTTTMRARTQEEIEEAIMDGEEPDEAAKVMVPVDPTATPPWEDQKQGPAPSTTPATLPGTSGTQMKDKMQVAEIKLVRAPIFRIMSEEQQWYARAVGAKKGQYNNVLPHIRQDINAKKRPWVKPHSGWINSAPGLEFIKNNPTLWTTSDAAPKDDGVITRTSPDVATPPGKVADKGGQATPPTTIPQTPTKDQMQKFAESEFKKIHFDLTDKPFDPKTFQETGRLRLSFTGKNGLGGGVTTMDVRKASDEAFLALMKDHPEHMLALIREILTAEYGKEQSLIALSKQNAADTKAA